MIDQFTFDKVEEINEALHDQDGLDTALIGILGDALPADQEKVVFALLHSHMHCRNRAVAAATAIIREGAT